MPALHIRDVDEKLVQRLKADAALSGITLREHVINQLGGKRIANHQPADVPRNKRVPVAKRSAPESQGISAPWQAGKRCLCGETWEQHWEGGRCLAEGCKCDKFEEA